MSDQRENKKDELNEAEEIGQENTSESKDFDGVDNPENVVDNAENPAENQEEDGNTKYLRLLADFQNYKRRSEKEKSDIYAYANEKLLAELIGVLDNFERALGHSKGDDNIANEAKDTSGASETKSFIEGMSMIFKNFKDVLEKAGLSEITALGEEFDPNIHNAIMTDSNSGYESGKVCEVVQKGYMLGERVVRPSMVKVAE